MSNEAHEKGLEAAHQEVLKTLNIGIGKWTMERVIRAYLQASNQVLVPREPTEEMVKHLQMNTEIGSYICENWIGAYDVMGDYHAAMLAAAPNPFSQANAEGER